MLNKNLIHLCLLLTFIVSKSQTKNKQNNFITSFDSTLNELKNILAKNGSFKYSVLLTESLFNSTESTKKDYFISLNSLTKLCIAFNKKITTQSYQWSDSSNHRKNLSICSVLKDSLILTIDSATALKLLPFTYNFTDPFGNEDFTNTFVTKLLQTHIGNCRSLAYLYKILADELGAKCWLSLAPNHIYIKNYSQKIGWYNTELTSGTFPTDAWIMTTGNVNPEAIKSSMYMDTLGNQQAIALCVLDLAKGYESQTKNYYDGFILKCCDLVLQYHPVNPMALLLKAETLKKVYLHEKEIHFPKPTVTESQMTEAYITLAKLGYREMSDRMYQKWLKSINEQKEKYSNKKVAKPSLKNNPL